jgi:hypothetical protein
MKIFTIDNTTDIRFEDNEWVINDIFEAGTNKAAHDEYQATILGPLYT